jgi:hypothetical protein
MRLRKVIIRTAAALVGAVALCAVAASSVLAYPQPLFPYHVAQGRLQLFSDRSFDAVHGRRVLADVERRIATSPLDGRNGVHRIFVAQTQWRRRLVFLWAYGAGGVNYYPLTRNVFIRQSDIDADRVFRSDGEPVPPPRTLAYYGAHEIGHSLIGERIGAAANRQLPKWIREGVADYIGFGGEVDIDALARALLAGEHELDPVRSGFYARYRLLVAWLLEREGWSIDRLLASRMTQADAEARLLRGTGGRRDDDYRNVLERRSAKPWKRSIS